MTAPAYLWLAVVDYRRKVLEVWRSHLGDKARERAVELGGEVVTVPTVKPRIGARL